MALVALPQPIIYGVLPMVFPGTRTGASFGSANTTVCDAAGDGVAYIFQATSTTPPDSVSFYISTVTTAGTTGNFDCTLETITSSTGAPSGTLVTNSATASAISTTANSIITATGMAGTASLTVGATYALVIRAGSGWDRNITIRRGFGSENTASFATYQATNTTGSWTLTNSVGSPGLNVGIAASGGGKYQIPNFAGPYTNFSTVSVSDSTNPDERGNRFVLPFNATVCGAVMWIGNGGIDVNDSFAVSLYSSHTATPSQLATVTFTGATGPEAPGRFVRFATAVDVTASTTYAIALKACGSSTQHFAKWDYNASGDVDWLTGTTSLYSTTRDGGSGFPAGGGNNFADSNIVVYAVFPLLSRVDDGAGGGGGGGGPLFGGRLAIC